MQLCRSKEGERCTSAGQADPEACANLPRSADLDAMHDLSRPQVSADAMAPCKPASSQAL